MVKTVKTVKTTGREIEARELTALLGAALSATWAEIRRRHPEVPDAVILVASGKDGKLMKWGHWSYARWNVNGLWRGEVLIAGELLHPKGGADPRVRPQVRVLEVLLHEAAHALADARGVKDTSRGHRYHNERYRKLAEELGLKCGKDGANGWHDTSVPLPTVASYERELERIREVLHGYRRPEAEQGPAPGQKGEDGEDGEDGEGDEEGEKTAGKRVAAVCDCGRRIRLSRSVLEVGPIMCGICEVEFKLEE